MTVIQKEESELRNEPQRHGEHRGKANIEKGKRV